MLNQQLKREAAAARKRLSRQRASAEAQEKERILNLKRKSEEIRVENTESQNKRLALKAISSAKHNAAQSPEDKINRLAAMVAYNSKIIESESPEEKINRLALKVEYNEKKIVAESKEAKINRLTAMVAYNSKIIEAESKEEKINRLALKVEYNAKKIVAESPEEKINRLALKVEYNVKKIVAESKEAKINRLAAMVAYSSKTIEAESPEESINRLAAQAVRSTLVRNSIAPEQKSAALISKKASINLDKVNEVFMVDDKEYSLSDLKLSYGICSNIEEDGDKTARSIFQYMSSRSDHLRTHSQLLLKPLDELEFEFGVVFSYDNIKRYYNLRMEGQDDLSENIKQSIVMFADGSKTKHPVPINSRIKVPSQSCRLLLQIRKFEIDMMTVSVEVCQSCGTQRLLGGVYSRNINSKKIKHVYKEGANKFHYVTPTNALATYIRLDTVCNACIEDIVDPKLKVPRFSSAGGFDHGMDLPAYFQDLSYAELALTSLIQPAICISYIKDGGKMSKGHVSFIDRTKSIISLAKTLPLLPSELHIVTLMREIPGDAQGMKKFKHHICRRDKCERWLEFKIKYYPGMENVFLDRSRFKNLPIDGYIDANIILDKSLIDDFVIAEDLGPARDQLQPQKLPVDDLAADTNGILANGNF